MERLALHIESLIFSAEHTISLNQIKTCIEDTLEQTYKNVEIKKAIDSLIEKYRTDDYSFEVVEIASGYKFLTKGSFHATVGTLIKKTNQKRLSKAALETLSIIAYKQPVTKSDVEGIRGVNCDYTIQKLLEKDLAAIKGRAEGPGRPLLYGTSDKFMDYFGIKDIDSLPKLQDLKVPEIQIGEPAPIEEDRVSEATEGKVIEEDTESEGPGLTASAEITDATQIDGEPSIQKEEWEEESELSHDVESSVSEIIEQEDEGETEISGEKPRDDEEAHQALLNQEIVSSVNIDEANLEESDSSNSTILSDEEE